MLVEGPHGVKILPGGSGVQSLTSLDEQQKMRLCAALDRVEDMFDLVLVDSGAGIGDNVLFFVGAAQEALLVVSPEPTSLVDAYAVVKVLSQQAGVQHFSVIINPVVDELPAREIFPKLTAVTSRFLSAQRPPPGLHPPGREPAPGDHGADAGGRGLPAVARQPGAGPHRRQAVRRRPAPRRLDVGIQVHVAAAACARPLPRAG